MASPSKLARSDGSVIRVPSSTSSLVLSGPLTIDSQLRLVGPRPVVFASFGDIVIDGTIDVAASPFRSAAGSDLSICMGSSGGPGESSASLGAGGGGGGFGTAGGAGGVAQDGGQLAGGLGGQQAGQDLLLRGGGGGGAAGRIVIKGTFQAGGTISPSPDFLESRTLGRIGA